MRHTLSTMVDDSGCIVCPGVMSMFFKAYKRIATVPTKITTSSELCGRIIYECTLHTSYQRGTVWLRRPSVQWSMKYFLFYCFQQLSETPHIFWMYAYSCTNEYTSPGFHEARAHIPSPNGPFGRGLGLVCGTGVAQESEPLFIIR